jgi:osmotically-inducible protein OsmY
MAKEAAIMTDRQVQEHVQKALDWEPSVDAAAIGVSVSDGIVTLRGDVRTYAEKTTAERVALRVYGTRAVANDIAVRLGNGLERTDSDIAHAALTALKWNTLIPEKGVTVTVSNGWITLNGQVDWDYQRAAAAKSVRDLTGVRGVINGVMVKPHSTVADVKAKIEAALKRSAEIDSRRIDVAVADGKVTLSGNVHSWFERNEARQAAWAAPGVREVDDRIAVVP